VAALLVAATACATVREGCAPSERLATSDLLYLGTARPSGAVTPEEWAEFLRTAVTPRFPQGLSVWPAAGQWQGAGGAVVPDPSFVLSLVHPPDEASEAAVRAIVAEYKSRFSQEAVLRVRSSACVSF
jgi:hypothetical protein